uniref:F-box domain-containing protein n=1 Tax=Bursaphelenchus xylophilus TaxID=6326 RepID=A0A1I7SC18_BURXY
MSHLQNLELELLRSHLTCLQRTSQLLLQAFQQRTNQSDVGGRKRQNATISTDSESKRSRLIPGVDKGTQTDEENPLPLEVFNIVFRFLNRDDLDRCRLVSKSWNALIQRNPALFPRRPINLLKLVCKDNIAHLSATSGHKRKEFSFPKEEMEGGPQLYQTLSRLLKNTSVKRWVVLNVNLSNEIVEKLHKSLTAINLEVVRVEFLAMNLANVSDVAFHKLIGKTIPASQYFLEAVRGARPEHFDRRLMEQESIMRADDFTIYDVESNTDVDMTLEIEDDIILKHIFGNADLPSRNSLYIDSPNVSNTFVKEVLNRFVMSQNMECMVNHVEIAHCRDQTINDYYRGDIIKEYEHSIQVEYSARNRKTNRLLEVRISRTSESDQFCHVTMNTLSEVI